MLTFLALLTLSPVHILATQEGVDPLALRAEWSEASPNARKLAMTAYAQVGVPYRYATSNPEVGFDCSGLVKYAAAAVGVDLPHNSGAQRRALEAVDSPEVGDLIWYPGHVAIYLGQGLEVHAPQPGRTVEVRTLPDRRLEFRRIVETLPETVMLGHDSGSGQGGVSAGIRYL